MKVNARWGGRQMRRSEFESHQELSVNGGEGEPRTPWPWGHMILSHARLSIPTRPHFESIPTPTSPYFGSFQLAHDPRLPFWELSQIPVHGYDITSGLRGGGR